MRHDVTVSPFEGSPDEWDTALVQLDGRTFCHQAAWADVLRESFGHRTIRLVARDADGAVQGLLPLVRMKSRIFGHHLISVPFLNYGGPVGGPDARTRLTAEAVRLARESGARLELRARQSVDLGLPVSHQKITVTLPLPDDPEVLWTDGLKAKVRSQVRRPMKEGMTAEFGAGYLRDFYRIFCRNMRDLGTPVLPWRFFDRIRSAFEEQLIVCVVLHGSEVVAGGVGFMFEDEFEITWASSSREHARKAPNMLLYWSMMEEVIRRGGSTFNFGRCTPGGGTHRFKRQWGGPDEQLHWSYWPESPAANGTEGGARDRATAIWQKLPLGLANRLGPAVSGSIPNW